MSKCEMKDDCLNPVTHIGEKGYVYCAEHVGCRQGWESCRKMRGWEKARIAAGKPLMSYRPITKAESDLRERKATGEQSAEQKDAQDVLDEQHSNYNAMIGESLARRP